MSGSNVSLLLRAARVPIGQLSNLESGTSAMRCKIDETEPFRQATVVVLPGPLQDLRVPPAN